MARETKEVRRSAASALLLVLLAGPASAAEPDWARYQDADYGYRIDVPYGMFVARPDQPGIDGMTLAEAGGAAVIDIHGERNAERTPPAQMADQMSHADTVSRVTYRAGGQNWIVLSGYSTRQAADGSGNMIFYTKLLFNPDHSAVASFEVTFPQSEKARMVPIVDRLEKSMTAPK